MDRKKFWQGAMLLTFAGLLMKVLSAFYRIPYQNIAGDIGFYIYQQVYPIYGICLVLTTYGFPVVISRLVASRLEQGEEEEANGVVYLAFLFLFLLGLGLFLFFFFDAHQIATFLGDPLLDKLIKVASGSFLLMPFLAVARGYFQGFTNMAPTAVSQVVEQVIRVSVIVCLSFVLVQKGFDSYIVGAGAMSGSIAGGIISTFILLYFMRKQIQKISKRTWSVLPNKGDIVKTIIIQGFFVCVSNLVLILMQFVDSITLYTLLRKGGELADVAKVMKGVYDRGIPLIQLGSVAATSFALPLVPLIAGARVRNDHQFIRNQIRLAMKITFVIGLAATVGLICVMKATNIMLFENDNGSFVLAVFVISILFSAISITAATILQGLGKVALPALFVIGGAVLKYVGNEVLVPRFGVLGAALATVCALLCIAYLNVRAIKRTMKQSLMEEKTILQLAFICFVMIIGVKGYMFAYESLFALYVHHRIVASFEAISAVGVGAVVYLLLLFQLHVFTEEELGTVWKGGKIPLILRARR